MRTTREQALALLAEELEAPELGRVELAQALIRAGAAHAVAVADLGLEGAAVVTRSLVVQAREAEAARALLHRLARGPLPDLSRPDPRALEGFCPPNPRGPGPLDLPSAILGPELRLVSASEMEIETYLGLFGRPGSSGIGRAWRTGLCPLTPGFLRLLRRTRAPRAEVEGAIALDASGRLLAADARAGPWLQAGDRAGRIPTLLRVARTDGAVDGPLDGARIHLRAAAGPLGDAWLGTVTVPRALERALDALLTPTQREVASYAAVGATCPEIAATLGTRVETVRSHVRDIYARLGISSRAELARRWAPLENRALRAADPSPLGTLRPAA